MFGIPQKENRKTGVKHNTKANYKFVQNILDKHAFGHKKIDSIKLSDGKIFLIKLQEEGKGYSSIYSIRGVLRPAFQMAVDDDLLVKNPKTLQYLMGYSVIGVTLNTYTHVGLEDAKAELIQL